MILILGGAQIGLRYGPTQTRKMPNKLVASMLEEAEKLGFRALDTAPGYGRSEALIGGTWKGQVHTKIASESDPVRSVNRSLQLLRRKQVDIAYFHDWRAMRSPKTLKTVHAKLIPKLATRLGVSIYDSEDWSRFLDLGELSAVQLPMSVIDRRLADVVWHHADPSKQIFIRSVLFRGLLAGNTNRLENSALRPQISRLREIANGHLMSIEELAIRWVSSAPGVSGIVLGADSLDQMRESARIFKKGALNSEVLHEIRNIPEPDTELLDLRKW